MRSSIHSLVSSLDSTENRPRVTHFAMAPSDALPFLIRICPARWTTGTLLWNRIEQSASYWTGSSLSERKSHHAYFYFESQTSPDIGAGFGNTDFAQPNLRPGRYRSYFRHGQRHKRRSCAGREGDPHQ